MVRMKMATANNKNMSNLFRFAFKYRQNTASSGTTAGISLRTAEIFRSLHTPSITRSDSKYESETRNQALDTLRRLGVQYSVQNCKKFVTKSIDKAYRSGEGRARIMSAFKFLKEEGLSIEEGMYSSCLCNYLSFKNMEEEFKFLINILKEENPDSSPVLGYYEMLLWSDLNDIQKIEEIGWQIIDRWDALSSLELNYLEALCVTYEDEFFEELLKTVDITKASSLEQLTPIFKYLGRSESNQLEAKRLLEKLKTTCKLGSTVCPEDISHLIFMYATSIEYDTINQTPVKDGAIEMCEWLHRELSIKPSLEFFEKLIAFECRSEDKVPYAAQIVNEMKQKGLIEDSEEGQYFYNTIERIYGADWLETTEAVISAMGLKQFNLRKFLDLFPEYIAGTSRRSMLRPFRFGGFV